MFCSGGNQFSRSSDEVKSKQREKNLTCVRNKNQKKSFSHECRGHSAIVGFFNLEHQAAILRGQLRLRDGLHLNMLFPNSDDYHSYGEQTNAYFQWWDNNDLKVNLQVIVRRSRLLNHSGLGKGNSGHNIGFAAPVKGRVGDTGRRAFDLPPFLVFRFVFLHKFFDFVG